MAYNERAAAALRRLLSARGDVTERKMFGGIAFMVGGHMCCGVAKDDIMFRVGPDRYQRALAAPDARPCDFTGRPMTGMILVSADATPGRIKKWAREALSYVAALPPKP